MSHIIILLYDDEGNVIGTSEPGHGGRVSADAEAVPGEHQIINVTVDLEKIGELLGIKEKKDKKKGG